MAHFVLMPQKGVAEESAVLAEWYVKPGDKVKPGDRLFSVENGKAAYDEEAEVEGTVLALLCEEGDELPVKAPVCVVGEEGEAFEMPKTAGEKDEEKTEQAAPAVQEAAPAARSTPVMQSASADGHLAASPRAKNLAARAGVDVGDAGPGTGPEGRIIERDVKAYLDSGRPVKEKAEAIAAVPTASDFEAEFVEMPVSRMRKIIGANMMKSLSSMAQLTLTASFDATSMLEFRKTAKANPDMGLEKLTINDMVMYAVARTLPAFPELNANFDGETMKVFRHVHLGFACDTEAGLVVPVIRDADTLSLLEISKTIKAKAAAAQAGNLPAADMTGGSFTVSNLGAFGIESFTPVINPPQTGILGVNTLETRVREENGTLKTYSAMGLSLTFDHRALDGAPAARFLKALCTNLEAFTLLLAK